MSFQKIRIKLSAVRIQGLLKVCFEENLLRFLRKQLHDNSDKKTIQVLTFELKAS